MQLRLDVPANAEIGTQTLTIDAKGQGQSVTLPVAVTLAKDLPAKLTVQPQLPELRGTARSSFEYQISVKNDSGKRLIVALAADAPRNFETCSPRATAARSSTRFRSMPASRRT